MTFLMPLPAAHVQKLLDGAAERSKLERSLPLGGGGEGVEEPDTQHCDMISYPCSKVVLSKQLASISLGPGQAPATKFPEHVSAVLRQVPEPELVVQLALTQHSTLSGSLGQ